MTAKNWIGVLIIALAIGFAWLSTRSDEADRQSKAKFEAMTPAERDEWMAKTCSQARAEIYQQHEENGGELSWSEKTVLKGCKQNGH